MKKKGVLCQEGLKLIACVTMLIDHTAVVFGLPMWLRVIGRLAFPIYCFLIVEGIAHTRSPGRYFLRLGIMAVISEPIYDFVLYGGRSLWAHQNVLWLLLLGALMVEGMGRVKQPVWKVLLIVPCYFIADALHLSYGGNGILLIALFALTRELPGGKWIQAAGMVLINGLMPSAHIGLFGASVSVQLFGALAMVPIALYSGWKRTKSKALSWGFYIFYPLHLLALYGLFLCIR